ncbi:MAG: hydroxyphenylacetyl-CoA thioesterase PaaI [Gammaproteobacteria bacterium]|nr:hydroxyphenylacetyl-CoA thioesterase PaaI [Gammaproteobacteria bacterium]
MNKSDIQLAEACTEAMRINDDASKLLGITITETRPHFAIAQMTVIKEMTNGHDICHGGVIFTLADSAFAYASNSTNHTTVASGCSIEFLAPAKIGDTLTSVATKRARSQRTGVYDIDVTNQRNELIAVFRGKSYQIRGQVIPEAGEQS